MYTRRHPLSLRQDGSIWDYLRAFKSLAATIETVQERIQESTFINGLKPDIKVEVRIMKPTGLSEVMKFAQKVEDWNAYSQSNNGGSRLGRIGNMGSAHSSILLGSRGLSHSTQFTHRLVSPSLNPYPPTRLDQNPNLNFPLPLSARPYGQRNSFNHKKPSDAELQVKIVKSICFKCDTKFSSGH